MLCLVFHHLAHHNNNKSHNDNNNEYIFSFLFQVNHTAIEQQDEVFDDECPDSSYSSNGNSSAVSLKLFKIN